MYQHTQHDKVKMKQTTGGRKFYTGLYERSYVLRDAAAVWLEEECDSAPYGSRGGKLVEVRLVSRRDRGDDDRSDVGTEEPPQVDE